MSKKDYSEFLKIPQMGDCILIHHTKFNIISSGIELVSGSKVSHVAMYVGGGNNNIVEYIPGGCTVDSLSKYLKDDIVVTVRRINGLTVDQAQKMKHLAYLDVSKKRKYDYLSYVGFIVLKIKSLFKKSKVSPDLPIDGAGEVCSSGYAEWCRNAGLDIFDELGDKNVTPGDILNNKGMSTIITY